MHKYTRVICGAWCSHVYERHREADYYHKSVAMSYQFAEKLATDSAISSQMLYVALATMVLGV